MKKIPVYFMLFVFLLNTLGYFPMLELNKYLVKKEIENLLFANPSRLVVIRVENPGQDPEFHRIHKGEFRYKGKMYDIASENTDGRFTIFICLNDKKEENLLKALAETGNNRFAALWWDHVVKIACPASFTVNCISTPEDLMFPDRQERLSVISIPVRVPPPECFS